MSLPVNPPPQLKIPDNFAKDPAQFAYFRQMNTILFQLWNRTGGTNDTVTDTANQQVDVDSLFGLFAQLDELEQGLNEIKTCELMEGEKEVFSVSSGHTTTGNEIVICTAPLTVTLNGTPDDLEAVDIKRADGVVVIDGNGKLIDGSATVTINRKYTSLNLIYTVETDGWNIV